MGRILALVTVAFGASVAFSGLAKSTEVEMSIDGPISTLAAAVEKVRELRAAGSAGNEIVTVVVRPGRYVFDRPVIFGSQDSGIRFLGRGWQDTVFDGGRKLPPFREAGNGLWETDVDDGFDFEQLWVNGRRAVRARTPNRFYLYMKDQDYLHGKSAFFADRKDIASLRSLSDDELSRVAVGIWQSWAMGYGRIKAVNAENGHVELADVAGFPLFKWNKTCPRYTLENYRTALDAPGEWFLDIKANKLLYMPRPGERRECSVAIVPVVPCIVEFSGKREKAEIVRDISFSGIGFEHTACRLGPKGICAAQAAVNVSDAIVRAQDAEGLVFENCRIAHGGAHGLWLRKGNRHVSVRHCLVEDLGAGGIYLGDVNADFKNRGNNAAFLEVRDSIIRHGGRLIAGGVGIWIGHVSVCSIVHNDIYDFKYSGVSSGWTWGYSETINRNIRVNHNRIHHIGQGELSDMGGVYLLGDQTGSEVCNNWIWEVNGYADNGSPAWGLYTDEGSRGVLLCDNLVEKCRDGAIHQHFGMENVYSNNIFATFRRYGARRSRNESHVSVRIMNNVFWWEEPAAGAYAGGGGYESIKDMPADGNIYWCTCGRLQKTAFMGSSWEEWRKAGMDARGAIADPLFVDAAHGDWRLKPGSPALMSGFRPFDWKDSGVCTADKDWVLKAAERTWDAFEDAPKAPRYLIERAAIDFERYSVGPLRDGMDGMLPFWAAIGKPGGISFTDKDVVQGKRAMVFTDSPENSQAWCPHLGLSCCITGSTAVIRFAFKPVKSGGMSFEARDYQVDGEYYVIGASLGYEGGVITANGKVVSPVELGRWADVEVRIGLGGKSAGNWSVSVSPYGGERKTCVFDKFKNAKFKQLTWVGFMSGGSNDGIWQLDDFRLSKEKKDVCGR